MSYDAVVVMATALFILNSKWLRKSHIILWSLPGDHITNIKSLILIHFSASFFLPSILSKPKKALSRGGTRRGSTKAQPRTWGSAVPPGKQPQKQPWKRRTRSHEAVASQSRPRGASSLLVGTDSLKSRPTCQLPAPPPRAGTPVQAAEPYPCPRATSTAAPKSPAPRPVCFQSASGLSRPLSTHRAESCACTLSALSPHGPGAWEEPPHAERSSWQSAQWGEEGKAGKSWEKSQHELTQIVPFTRAKAVIFFFLSFLFFLSRSFFV